MTHKFERTKGKHLTTTNVGDQEIDVFRIGNKIIAFLGGTDTPIRMWKNRKDFDFTLKLANIRSTMI